MIAASAAVERARLREDRVRASRSSRCRGRAPPSRASRAASSGRRSSRPIASETRRTRCEWPAVYGSRASTAAFSVSIVSRSVASSSREDSTRSCDRAARASFCAAHPRGRASRQSGEASQSRPKTSPTAYQIVRFAAPVVAVTTSSSSDTSAAPTTRPRALWSGAHTFTTGAALPAGSTSCALGTFVRTTVFRSGLVRRRPIRSGLTVEKTRRPSRA